MELKLGPIASPIKWPGGKRWLVQNYPKLIPEFSGKYIEPFAGGAAVFFHLSPRSALLADTNRELINTYEALRDCWKEVLKSLAVHNRSHSDSHYYTVRSARPRTLANRAARFIYLNRTCFNGLYRVNKLGQFNVPKGTKDSVLRESDDFGRVSNILNNTELLVSDFESVIDAAKAGDLVFVDPPYTVAHRYNGFIKYNEVLFSWDDQIRLAESLRRASGRNVKIIATNADHMSLCRLYENDFKVQRLERNSLISASSSMRKPITELLITSG
jgi:DNA adenine methylase